MNFQDLKKIENAKFYLDVAFTQANKRADAARETIKIKSKQKKYEKAQRIEHLRINTVAEKLIAFLDKINKDFPSMDNLPEFYGELVKCTLDYDKIKKSLSTVHWARTKIEELSKKSLIRINSSSNEPAMISTRRAFSGRVGSIMKRIDKDLAYLEEARKEMKAFPTIKTSLFTVSITGFPNVGKSTLLKKMTSASPEIKDYAFTTKTLNLGYAHINDIKVQFIDTPGTLNRYNAMNPIEKKAFLAMKYVTNLFIFVFDLTEPYPLEKQKALFSTIQEFDKPILVYLSKTDILDKKKVKDFCASCNAITSVEDLEAEIEKEMSVFEA